MARWSKGPIAVCPTTQTFRRPSSPQNMPPNSGDSTAMFAKCWSIVTMFSVAAIYPSDGLVVSGV